MRYLVYFRESLYVLGRFYSIIGAAVSVALVQKVLGFNIRIMNGLALLS